MIFLIVYFWFKTKTLQYFLKKQLQQVPEEIKFYLLKLEMENWKLPLIICF